MYGLSAFVEEHGADVLAHEAAAERDLLLRVGREAGGAAVELAAQLEHLGDHADALLNIGRRNSAVAQRERKVLGDRHRVVDDRELEHLRDVALLRCLPRDIDAVEPDAALRRRDQARDDVQQRGLAAA